MTRHGRDRARVPQVEGALVFPAMRLGLRPLCGTARRAELTGLADNLPRNFRNLSL